MTNSARIRLFSCRAASIAGTILIAALSCAAQVSVLTQHNDNSRTGLNPNEKSLNTSNVNTTQFGKLFSLPVDGQVYAQPLYVPNVVFPGNVTHNVVIVATQNDSVFAFDADSGSRTPLWTASLVDWTHSGVPGETPLLNAPSTLGCSAIKPDVGIISTPVIDATTSPTPTIYVVAKSVSGSTYMNRLHALDITTGSEKTQGPVVISAAVTGTGDASQNGTLTFNPQYEFNRTGLLLLNGNIYIGFASVCYPTTFHGWIFAYDEASFNQKSVFATTPNGVRGGIWTSGSGMSADSNGFIYAATGDGTYDTTIPITDFGDAILKLSTSINGRNNGSLNLSDYFVPYDQANLLTDDTDLGSGGVLLLPDQTGGSHVHELVQAGKEGRIYLVDRDQMTSNPSAPSQEEPYCASCSSDPQIVQESPFDTGAIFGSPAYWNNNIYYWGVGDVLRSIPISNGLLNYPGMTTNSSVLGYPGAVPAVSSNGTVAGSAILWAIDATQSSKNGPAVLNAYDASNISNLLWNSSQAANNRDQAGAAVKFATPTIANGKVYIGTSSEVDVFGLLPVVTPVSVTLGAGQTQQFTVNAQNLSGQTVTWSVAPGQGSFSSTTPGLYTAPASITSPETITVQATLSGGSTGTATISLITGTATSTAVVSFLNSDSTTEGNWGTLYGGDGYALAAVTPQKIPDYATFTPGAQTYTWNSTTTDPRALLLPGGSSGIAAAWYSTTNMSFDVNIADGQLHQVAIYAVDWDSQGRSEMVQILDATTSAVLDTENITGFTGGNYLVWNISGHVKFKFTVTGGPNAVVNGFFFGGAVAGASSISVNVTPPSITLTGSQTQQFTASVTGSSNQSVTWSYSPEIGTLTTNGFYTAPEAIASQTVTITATSGADETKSASATVTLTGGAVANFIHLDTGTEGSWQGVYGTDGYFIAQDAQVIPDYASFTVQNDDSSFWVNNTTDPRALETGNGSGRIASSWYSFTAFNFDVNFTDGKLHQFALYALDWDNQGRSETVQIVDATTSAILDTRTISNFSNGTYLVWNISGNVKINITPSGGPNAVISGAFFDPATSSGPESVSITPLSVGLSAGGTQQFTATIHNAASQAITWTVSAVSPTGAAPGSFSTTTAGFYTAPASVTVAETVTVEAALGDGTFGTATVNLTPTITTSGPAATYVKTDTTTEGNWPGTYGVNGEVLANVTPQNLPTYATFQVQNQSNWTWASTTTDPRALEIPGGTGGIAATWYNASSFSFNVNFTDGATHQLALYAVDWDNQGRSEKIQITNATTSAVLDTETISNFYNGAYVSWDITGNVKITVTALSGPNSVISGLFFDPAASGGTETVTVNPTSANLNAGGTQQFGATVRNGTSQTVMWSVSAVTPTGAPAGSFSTTTAGLYMAPATVTVAETVTIQATSADGKASGTATVTLNPTVLTESVSVTPTSATLTAGGTQQFAATVTNGPSQTVSWSVSAVTPTGAPAGSFSTTMTGLYIAPATVTVAETVTVQATSADGTASGTATVTLNPTVVTGGAVVTYIGTDTTTEGSWTNTYGGDGYALANVSPESIPSYATTFQVQNQSNWTWASTTSDPRALQIPGGSTGIAATWYGTSYGSTAFSFSVDLTSSHQLALYAVDWDKQGRSETIQILDAGTKNVLDTRSISNFTNGTYLVWDISGNVIINVAVNGGPNAVVSGVFFGGGTATVPASPALSISKTHTGSFAQGQTGATYTVTVSNGTGAGPTSGAVTVTETIPSGLTLVSMQGSNWSCTSNTCTRNDVLNGGASYPPITVTVNVASNASSPQVNQVSVSGGNSTSANATDSTVVTVTSTGPSSASFVGFDQSTQGNWMGVYGQDGYSMALGTTQLPSYVPEVTPENQLNYLWAASTTDVRALETDSQGDRLAATWYNALQCNGTCSNRTFSVDVNVASTTPQRVALYAVDFSFETRVETIQIVDAASGTQLDSETISNFTNGIYLIWNISGHVTINVTNISGENAVVSAIFFGGKSAPATAQFVKSDISSQGNWIGVYGSDGESIANSLQGLPSYVPPSFTISTANMMKWTWAGSTMDTRALQTDTLGDRIAATYYGSSFTNSTFTFDVNFTDGNSHQIALYAVDWDHQSRKETIQIVDGSSVQTNVLDTETLTNFGNGTYLVWNVSGHVIINVTLNGGVNAVVSGVFFSPVSP